MHAGARGVCLWYLCRADQSKSCRARELAVPHNYYDKQRHPLKACDHPVVGGPELFKHSGQRNRLGESREPNKGHFVKLDLLSNSFEFKLYLSCDFNAGLKSDKSNSSGSPRAHSEGSC